MSGFNQDDTEAVYERLAEEIDAAGPRRAQVFLAKVALLLANEIADRGRVLKLVDEAAGGLDDVAED